MFSMLKNLKKYNRSLYDQVENEGLSSAFKAEKPGEPELGKPKVPKFAKLKGMLGKPPKE